MILPMRGATFMTYI